MGIQRTREALNKQGNTWQGMNTHIRQYLRECPYCQKTATKLPEVQVTPYTVSSRQPMTVRAIDTLGPFPEDEDGYTHMKICFLVSCACTLLRIRRQKIVFSTR
jgi:hypothetical protein